MNGMNGMNGITERIWNGMELRNVYGMNGME